MAACFGAARQLCGRGGIARECGAFQRSRKIRSAGDLLRIIFAYCGCPMSLRHAAGWATLQGIGNVSDVAVLKRIRNALPWLEHLLAVLLDGRLGGAVIASASGLERQIYLVDATFMKMVGQQKGCWRWHMMLHLNRQQICFGLLTNHHICETLEHYPIEKGSLYIADRGYARASQVQYVMEHGGDFILRGGIRQYFAKLTTLQRNICEPPRKRIYIACFPGHA